MPVEQALTIKVRPTPTSELTILDTDAVGVKDGSGRYWYPPIEKSFSLLAASVDAFIWTCIEGIWQVTGVVEAHTVVGGSGATVNVVVCPGSVAIASGTAQLSAALDLTVTAPAKQFGTLIASPTQIFRGDSVGIDMSGTLTGLVGVLTVQLKRVG